MGKKGESSGKPHSPKDLIGEVLACILIVMIIIAVIIWIRSRPITPPVPPPVVKDQTETRAEFKKQGGLPSTPSGKGDPDRVRRTYPAGMKLRSSAQATAKGRASAKDWGISADMNFAYLGEMVILRTVEFNDGNKMVELIEFPVAKTVSIHTNVEDIKIDLDERGEAVLKGIDIVVSANTGLPPGWTAAARTITEDILNLPFLKQGLGQRILADESTKVLAFLSELQGKQVRVTYVNGEGVTEITPLNGPIPGDVKGLLYSLSLASDVYLFPRLECKPGDSWSVRGQDLPPILDPSMMAVLDGSIQVTRRGNRTVGGDEKAVVSVESGALELRKTYSGEGRFGRWTPKGEFEFSLRREIITKGHLAGSLFLERATTKHFLFEARHAVEPTYDIKYTCEVLER